MPKVRSAVKALKFNRYLARRLNAVLSVRSDFRHIEC
jgi:hypothetical protein